HKLGAFVTVNDKKPLQENPQAQDLLEQGIKVITGSHPIELLDEGYEYIVKNPGIPYSNPLVRGALERGIPVLTEIELAYLISEAPIIGITGTNGKTTTTTLIFEMLDKDGKRQLIAGNIGKVASKVAQKATEEHIVVMELSSFQLMGV
ncbi:UDP-N-acetylmuramoyl-L-alanine--D-glutamate ligase, partial [Geobacillus sp. NFOSA3]|nr:UDP-N-acetylmuramoyl-L-alanine--D-glutamate ligase [Geobacillus sp. NFOSA3]